MFGRSIECGTFLGSAVVSSLFSVSWVEYFPEVWRLLLQTSPCLPLRDSSLLPSESELTPHSTSLVGFPRKQPTRLKYELLCDTCTRHHNNCHCVFSGVEIATARWRVLAGASPYYFWLVGYVILSGYAYFIRSWRLLVWVGTLILVPYLLHFWWVC